MFEDKKEICMVDQKFLPLLMSIFASLDFESDTRQLGRVLNNYGCWGVGLINLFRKLNENKTWNWFVRAITFLFYGYNHTLMWKIIDNSLA